MRNSPFQLKKNSVPQTLEINQAYSLHRRNISEFHRTVVSPQDYYLKMQG